MAASDVGTVTAVVPVSDVVAGLSTSVSSSSLQAGMTLSANAMAGTTSRCFRDSFIALRYPRHRPHTHWARYGAVSVGSFDEGTRIRTEVLGAEHCARSAARATDLDRPFLEWITTNVWGDLWADPTLDRKTRSMITIAILAALGRDELTLHLEASVRTGVTDAELAQVLQHVAVYAGVPAANHAFHTAKTAREISEPR